jgi:hypothetical protein
MTPVVGFDRLARLVSPRPGCGREFGDAEILAAGKEAGQLLPGGNRQSIVEGHDNGLKLADLGISRDLSSRAQTLAAMPVRWRFS